MNNHRISKLGLGTVQFGMDYGISNHKGRISKDEVRRILKLAYNAGIRCLDTASQYGDSEQILGETMPAEHRFRVITKTPHFTTGTVDNRNVSLLNEMFQQSLERLKIPAVYGLMIHSADDLLARGGEKIFQAMLELRNSGQVQKIGVSVYTADQIDAVVNRYRIDIMQVPLSILDQRLIKSGHLKTLKDLGVEIHARSIFLQGLLLMNPDELPAQFDSVRDHLKTFHTDCAEQGVSTLVACLDFAVDLPFIDSVVLGVCSRRELEEILGAIGQTTNNLAYLSYAWQDEDIINPAIWK